MPYTYHPCGKDQITEPGFDIPGESFHTTTEIIIALIKAIIAKGLLTAAEIKAQL